ncbi:hypothetical protein AYI69_g5202 [Smittium culicis]|uniref:Uncharacterized protein n=1 Tax=Smittium culicis TaxID=133412 RepID=A0A1R1Y7G6_9FUNG|nr:hypothetical protein AYI69_g5202 [Smittium culicis]
MELPGRAPQQIESKTNPLISKDKLDTMINAKKTVSKSRAQRKYLFRQRQQICPKPRNNKDVSPKERRAKFFLKRERILALSRANYVLSGVRTSRYVPSHSGKTHRQSMDEEHSRERVCVSVQGSNPGHQEKFPETGEFYKFFCERVNGGTAGASPFVNDYRKFYARGGAPTAV